MQNIKAAVQTQEQHVVGCDILDISQFVYHVELGQNGQRLKPDAERPQKVDWVERLMHNDGCKQSSAVKVVMGEIVGLTIQTETIGLFEFHEVDGVGCEGDEYYLHDEDVEGFPAEKEVDIASQEHSQKQLLGAVGQS